MLMQPRFKLTYLARYGRTDDGPHRRRPAGSAMSETLLSHFQSRKARSLVEHAVAVRYCTVLLIWDALIFSAKYEYHEVSCFGRGWLF